MNDQVKALLAKRRDRSIAILLGYKERECDEFLPSAVRVELRKVVLDQINDFYELCLDLMASVDNDSVTLNELYLDKIDSIYESIARESHGAN